MLPYNPPATKNIQKGIGPLDPKTLCTPSQRDKFIALIQPLFPVPLTHGEVLAQFPNDYDYTVDPTDPRRKFTVKGDGIQEFLIGPYLQLMFKKGIGAPGYFYWRQVTEVGGKDPGKRFPDKLDWKDTPMPVPVTKSPVTSVVVTPVMSQMLAG